MKARALVCSLMLAAASVGVMDAMRQQSLAPSEPPEPPLHLTPSEILLYQFAPTLIGWTPKQIHHFPALHDLRPVANPDQLPMVLERAGQRCALLFRDFLQVSADEEVLSVLRFQSPNPITGTLDYPPKLRKFRYIIIPRPNGDLPGFEEYRTDLKGAPRDATSLGDLFMITSDFVSIGLHLSASDQPGSNFRYFGIQEIRSRKCHVVGFAQDPKRARHVEELDVEGGRVILLVQGLAWVDAQTFQILRVMTWLLAPRKDIGLTSQVSTVDFYPVQPSGSERVLWLPRDVTVRVHFRDIDIRNTHHYSNFRLFRVESTIKPGT